MYALVAAALSLLAPAPSLRPAAARCAPPRLSAAATTGQLTVARVARGHVDRMVQMASLLTDAFYGRRSLRGGPLAWAQRQVIEADVRNELVSRLEFYSLARELALPHQGAVLVAAEAAGPLDARGAPCGFVEVGLPAWSEGGGFQLPKHPRGASGAEPPELRAYVSNLAVDESARRRGVGRLLMHECEAEVRRWRPAQRRIWLEVTETNVEALAFYERLGYVRVGRSTGQREIVRRRFAYELTTVERIVFCKELEYDEGERGQSGSVEV